MKRKELTLSGAGCQTLLSLSLSAFFSSRQCPGTAIRAAMDWAVAQIKMNNVVISGFHSPLEQSVLKVLIQARSPAVVVLARPVEVAKLPSAWTEPISHGFLTIVSGRTQLSRVTRYLAAARNDLVVQLADVIVVAYVSPNGALAAQCAQWRNEARHLIELNAPRER